MTWPLFSAVVTTAVFVLLVWLERQRPLRRPVESKPRRLLRNLTVGAMGLAVVQFVELPITLPLALAAEEQGWGLLGLVGLPRWLEVGLSLVLLDYTLYIWHVLTHRVPLLWRFHLVHHVDLDLDASTALRFHFGELVLSLPWRAAQILAIGVVPSSLLIWEGVVVLLILFHHSNLALPSNWERCLVRVVVTPRMHGIHHSTIQEETNSNWSSGLTVWDYIHRTLRLNVPQAEITIGVPPYRDPKEVGLIRLFVLPFVGPRVVWPAEERSRARRRACSPGEPVP